MIDYNENDVLKLVKTSDDKYKQVFDEVVKKHTSTYSDEDKLNLGKKQRKTFIATFWVLLICGILWFAGAIICFIFLEKEGAILLISGVISIGISFTIVDVKMLKVKDYKQWFDYIAARDLKRQVITQRNYTNDQKRNNRFYDEKIKAVYLLDSYTEFTDKLHAVLNYQEIIQTRYYKFKVVYENGNEKVVDVKEGSKEYSYLIKFVKSNEEIKQQAQTNTEDITEQLRKLKTLLDDKIITEEEFVKKKQELLDKIK